MEKHARIINYETLEKICNNKEEFKGVILGHENCPHFYRQLDIDKMLQISIEAGLEIRVNIPVLFEEYLQEFKSEAERLINKYPGIRIIVNDWEYWRICMRNIQKLSLLLEKEYHLHMVTIHGINIFY